MVDSNISEPQFNYSMNQKESIIDISFYYINLKMLYIKFQLEASFIKYAVSEIGSLSKLILMTGIFKDDMHGMTKQLKEILNKSYHSLEKRKSVFEGGKILLNTKEKDSFQLKMKLENIKTTNPQMGYIIDYSNYVTTPLYDQFFKKFINIKSTLIKFLYKTSKIIPSQRDQLLNDFMMTALVFEINYSEKSDNKDYKFILCYLYFYVVHFLIEWVYTNLLKSLLGKVSMRNYFIV